MDGDMSDFMAYQALNGQQNQRNSCCVCDSAFKLEQLEVDMVTT